MEERIAPHEIVLRQGQHLAVTGVSEVLSFDETAVVLATSLGNLTVLGEQLQLKNLSQDGGKVAVEGRVTALQYEQPRAAGWRRIFG